MNLITQQDLEDILQKFIQKNGYVSPRPVDFTLAVQKVKKELEIHILNKKWMITVS